MRIFVAMPHFFREDPANATNKSASVGGRAERFHALVSAVTSLHQSFGPAVYGLDHGRRIAWQARTPEPPVVDLVICTTGAAHLLGDLALLQPLFRHHAAAVDPTMLGFECHRLMRAARGDYDYYCYVEDDIVLRDPLFFRKRVLFDRRFEPQALLQPNRFELSPIGPLYKLYVDYRMAERVTAPYQTIAEQPCLRLPFAEEMVEFERTSYPSSGCFFLNAEQLDLWVAGAAFLDGDLSYLGPLDSAATLSIMKIFRVYKPVLDHAWFLEVLHASPRWAGTIAGDVTLVPPADRPGGGNPPA